MASSRSDQFPLTSWLIQYVEKSSETNFIDLTEIKSTFQSDVLVEVPSSRTIGNLITTLFHGVKIKPGRCKDNWAKSTQRYYGLSWCNEPSDNAIINFNNLASFLPPDFFVISNTSNNNIVGYFTRYLVNGNRAMIEINIFSEGIWTLNFMGKIIDLNNLGIGTSFDFQRKTLDLIVDTVKRLRYCDGVTDGDYKTTLKYFREQVTKVGEYTNRMRCRAKNCATILSFTAINLTCYNCNMICKWSQSLLESESNDENENVTLSENDHTDLSDILKTVFPECNLKISTFLCSQKWLWKETHMEGDGANILFECA